MLKIHPWPSLGYLKSHPSNIEFMLEDENNSFLPYLDVLVTCLSNCCWNSVYCIPTHTKMCLHSNSHYHLSINKVNHNSVAFSPYISQMTDCIIGFFKSIMWRPFTCRLWKFLICFPPPRIQMSSYEHPKKSGSLPELIFSLISHFQLNFSTFMKNGVGSCHSGESFTLSLIDKLNYHALY